MGEDEKSGEKSSQKQIMQPPPYGRYPPEADEIDLADLVGVFFRRKGFIAVLTILFACLAFGTGLMMTEKYEAMSMVEVGKVLTERGYEKVESSDAVKNRLNSLAKAVAGKIRKNALDNGQSIKSLGFSIKGDLKIDAPEDGTIASLELTAPKDSKALAMLTQVNRQLIKDHNRIFSQRQMEIKNKIARDELAINNIDIKIGNLTNRIAELKREYEEKTGEKENHIEKLASSIKDIESRKNFIKEKISLLQQEKEDLKTRIEEAETRYEKLMDSKLAANSQAQGAEAVGLMLFSS